MKVNSPSALDVLAAMVFFGQILEYMNHANYEAVLPYMVKVSVKDTDAEAAATAEVQLVNSGGGNSSSTSVVATNETAAGNETAANDTAVAAAVIAVASDGISCKVDKKKKEKKVQPPDYGPRYDWTEMDSGTTVSGFGYGYVVTQIIGGRMADTFGFKWIYGSGLLFSSFATISIPFVAKYSHAMAVFGVRFSQGYLQGVTMPALHAMAARWLPIERRASFAAKSYMSYVAAMVFTAPLSRFLASKLNWEATFYAVGGATILWFVFWTFLIFDSPDDHPRIKRREKRRIMRSLRASSSQTKGFTPFWSTPWCSMFTSLPFLGIMLIDCADVWGQKTFERVGPTFVQSVLGIDISIGGVPAAAPLICKYLGGVGLAAVADTLYDKDYLGLTTTRRLFAAVSALGPATAMVLMSFAACGDGTIAVLVLCLAFFINGGLTAGYLLAHLDISPNYAGTLLGISRTLSIGAIGLVVPTVNEAITSELPSPESWKVVFILAAAIYLTGTAAFVLLFRAETQDWNDETEKKVRGEELREKFLREERRKILEEKSSRRRRERGPDPTATGNGYERVARGKMTAYI